MLTRRYLRSTDAGTTRVRVSSVPESSGFSGLI